MSRLNQNGFGFVVVFVFAVILLGVGFVSWRVVKKPSSVITTSPTNDDCGEDRQCLYQAFNSDCSEKRLKITRTTIEGDPVITVAKVSQGYEGCIVEVQVDGSKDRFGDGKVHTYTCEKLAQENQILIANKCVGSSEKSVTI